MKTNNGQQNYDSATAEMDQSALHDLFIDELKDIYWAEKHLVKNLPKVAKAEKIERK